MELLKKVQSQWKGKRKFRFKNKLYSIDASVIDLCLSIFDWAKFRSTKGAVKLHLVYRNLIIRFSASNVELLISKVETWRTNIELMEHVTEVAKLYLGL